MARDNFSESVRTEAEGFAQAMSQSNRRYLAAAEAVEEGAYAEGVTHLQAVEAELAKQLEAVRFSMNSCRLFYDSVTGYE